VMHSMNLEAIRIQDRYEAGFEIGRSRSGQPVPEQVRQGTMNHSFFTFKITTQGDVLTKGGLPLIATVHGHTNQGGRLDPFDKSSKREAADGGHSSGDDLKNVAKPSGAPAFVIVPGLALLKVDPRTEETTSVLTEKDFTNWLAAAEKAYKDATSKPSGG
jgi:hypothetical protein